jgi:hypothetical protein
MWIREVAKDQKNMGGLDIKDVAEVEQAEVEHAEIRR